MARVRPVDLALLGLLCGSPVAAQTHPLAALAGRVTDPTGAPIAAASVTVASTALQGERSAIATAAGDYLVPFLPPGSYDVVVRSEGYGEARARRTLRATETSRLDVRLAPLSFEGTTTVRAEPALTVGGSGTTSTTYGSALVERLPIDRAPRGAALLTPGVAASGPAGNPMIAGAMSYENLYVVDGVAVKDRVFGQPRPFAVEEAIAETSTAVAGVSAAYGRFAGGVVNVVTRSGGNELAGAVRVDLESDAWRSRTPFERERLDDDPRERDVVPTYEATLGGPLRRDRLWFFLAGRRQETARSQTTAYTNLPYTQRTREARLQAKLTGSPGPGQSVRLTYGEIDTRESNVTVRTAMDLASLSSRSAPEDLLSLHYTATVGRRLFLEGQHSRRRRDLVGVGGRTTDLLTGTVLRDRSRGDASWNSPAFCGVCGAPPGELRRTEEEDRGTVVKASGLFSGRRLGSSELVGGVELFDELRRSDSYQSGSGFLVTATQTVLIDGAIHPVFLPGGSTFIEWRPLLEPSRGSRFRTLSAFVNDLWRPSERWTFNLGLRWDQERSRDQSGRKASQSEAWSPRLAAAFVPRPDGRWTLDAGYARYVAALDFSIGDFATGAGRPARYTFTYDGPAVNAGPPGSALLPTHEALALLFDWFFSNGGTSRPLRQAPSIPGLNRVVGPDLVLPSSDEVTLGLTRRFDGRGVLRLAGVRREFRDRQSSRIDLATGKVTDPGSGAVFDRELIVNGRSVERTYRALFVQADLRMTPALRLALGYTLSETRGNFDGDDASAFGGATLEDDLAAYPEYGEPRWRAPVGPLASDQRHRLRLWALYDAPIPERWGRLSVSALERLDSGRPWNVVGEIDSRPYVDNPGYAGPPARVPYFFERRGSRRTETATATDLALHYALPAAKSGRVELFVRLVVVNLFDESAQIRPGDTTVLTSVNGPRFVPFDPFAERPVQGVHWGPSSTFGSALAADDFQQPRTFSLGFGLRF